MDGNGDDVTDDGVPVELRLPAHLECFIDFAWGCLGETHDPSKRAAKGASVHGGGGGNDEGDDADDEESGPETPTDVVACARMASLLPPSFQYCQILLDSLRMDDSDMSESDSEASDWGGDGGEGGEGGGSARRQRQGAEHRLMGIMPFRDEVTLEPYLFDMYSGKRCGDANDVVKLWEGRRGEGGGEGVLDNGNEPSAQSGLGGRGGGGGGNGGVPKHFSPDGKNLKAQWEDLFSADDSNVENDGQEEGDGGGEGAAAVVGEGSGKGAGGSKGDRPSRWSAPPPSAGMGGETAGDGAGEAGGLPEGEEGARGGIWDRLSSKGVTAEEAVKFAQCMGLGWKISQGPAASALGQEDSLDPALPYGWLVEQALSQRLPGWVCRHDPDNNLHYYRAGDASLVGAGKAAAGDKSAADAACGEEGNDDDDDGVAVKSTWDHPRSKLYMKMYRKALAKREENVVATRIGDRQRMSIQGHVNLRGKRGSRGKRGHAEPALARWFLNSGAATAGRH